jgi:hypothetical protein
MIPSNLSRVHLTTLLLTLLLCLITHPGPSSASPLGTGISPIERLAPRAGINPAIVSPARGGRKTGNKCIRENCETPDVPQAPEDSNDAFAPADFPNAPEKQQKVQRTKQKEKAHPNHPKCSPQNRCSGECCELLETCVFMEVAPKLQSTKWRTCCSSGESADEDGKCYPRGNEIGTEAWV